MGTRVYTVYFRSIPEEFQEADLKEIFKEYGEITKLFIHHNRSYGMVEYRDLRSCYLAIENLHNKPPLNMYVSLAKSNTLKNGEKPDAHREKDFDETSVSSSMRTFFSDHPTNRVLNQTTNHRMIANNEDVYMYVDKHNKTIDEILFDENGRIYVPLDRVTGVTRIYKRKGNMNAEDYYKNPQNYVVEDLSVTNGFDSTSGDLSEHSVYSMNSIDRRSTGMPNRNNIQQPNHNQTLKKKDNKSRGKKPPVKSENEENWCDETSSVVKPLNKPEMVKPKLQPASPPKPKVVPESPPKPKVVPESPPKPKVVSESPPKKIKSPEISQQKSTNIKTAKVSINVEPSESSQLIKKPSESSQLIKKPSEISQLIKKSSEASKMIKKPSVEPKPKISVPSIKLPRNEYISVVVTHRIDDNTVWVNASEFVDKLEYIVEECKDKEFEKITNVEVGDYCLAIMQGLWCRVKVLEKNPKIYIHVIDLGYKEYINISYLHKVPLYILDIPALAVLIQTEDGSPPITEDIEELRIKIVGDIPEGYKVEIEDETTEKLTEPPKIEKEKFVNKIFSMLETNVAGYISPVSFLSETKFISPFLPETHLDELNKLTEMTYKCEKDITFSPEVGDLVAGEHDAEGWCRAIYLGNKDDKNKLAFIDYGVEAFVDEIRPVPDVYRDIPWFSCVCTVSAELSKIINNVTYFGDETPTLNFKIKSLKPNGASLLIIKDEEVVGEGNVEPWDPTKNLRSEDKKKDVITELCSGDRIQLILESDGYLFVRTKYCDDLLKKVKDLINKNISSLPYVKTVPKKGQMVAALFENEWYRAVVNDVDNNMVTVLYVDYGNEEQLQWKELKELNKDLKQIPFTVFKIKLKGYPGKFTMNAIQHLGELQANKTLLTVTFDGSIEDGVQLITKSGASILDVLMKLDAPSKPVSINSKPFLQVLSKYQTKTNVENKKTFKVPSKNDKKIMANDFNLQEVNIGKQNVRILALINSSIGLFSFCLNKEDVINEIHGQLNSDIQYYVNNLSPFDPSYKPEVGEVILAKTDENWKRALVSEVLSNDSYEVFLIDHGTTPTVDINNIRRISPDLIKLDSIASLALVNELTTDNCQIEKIIEKTLKPGLIIDMIVISKDESEMYCVEIPQLTKELQKIKTEI